MGGLYASHFRYVPVLYIVFTFLVFPIVALTISFRFGVHMALGLVLLLGALASAVVFGLWWWRGLCGSPGSYRVLSKEQREASQRELINSNAAVVGVKPEEYVESIKLKWIG